MSRCRVLQGLHAFMALTTVMLPKLLILNCCGHFRVLLREQLSATLFARQCPAGRAWRIGYNALHPDARPTLGAPGCTGARKARAKVAELADALDLGSSGETRESSSLSFRTSSPSVSQPRSWLRGSRSRGRGLY